MKYLAFLVATVVSLLVVRPYIPMVTMANQLLAILGWGLVMLVAPAPALQRSTARAALPLLIVFAMAAAGCLASILTGGMPSPPGIGVLGIIVLAAAVTLHGVSAGANDPVGFFQPFAVALVVGGILGAIVAILQIFAPTHLDNTIVAYANLPGRASGNIGQSNQFADTMLWGLIALVALAHKWRDVGSRMPLARVGWCAAAFLMIRGVVLTGSRTALVAMLGLATWGLADRNLSRLPRIGLVLAPVVAGATLLAVNAWLHAQVQGVSPYDRAGGAGLTAFRNEIWANALVLIREQPWLGVGWGQFNFAWSLTPFTTRGAGLVDNVHNLPLQLAVELGVPAALVMMGLLVAALWIAFRRVRRLPGEAGVDARSTLMIVVLMGLHSMLEYPLWYAYMLLPTAWAFGLALGTAARVEPTAGDAPLPLALGNASPLRAWRVLGAMMMVLSVSAWIDYLNIVSLFRTPLGLMQPEDIARARSSPLFGNQADYIDLTRQRSRPELLQSIERTSRVLVNSRLLYAWSNILQSRGETDKARFLAARMREFNLEGARDWFNVCSDPAVTVKPFQCLAPDHPVTWRDFR